jgi:DNA-binding FadR family transcriptional regulator
MPKILDFVKIVPRQGIFVNDYSRNGNIDTLIEVMNYQDGSLDKKALDSLLQYRVTAECDCAYLAALNRTDEDIRILEVIKDQMALETDAAKLASLKIDFHQTLYCATGNTIYPLLYNSFKHLSYSFHKLIYTTYGVDEATLYLDQLISNIKDKRPDSTRRTMHKLITHRIEQIRDHYYTTK